MALVLRRPGHASPGVNHPGIVARDLGFIRQFVYPKEAEK